MKRWHWYAIALLVAVIVGVLLDDAVAALVVAMLGGAAAARDRLSRDDRLGDAYQHDIPTDPDTTLEQIEDEVHDAATDEVDHGAPVGPGGTDTIADDIEWADDAR